uniref:Lipocalin n=1 Tax=Rhipicephalus zambeziensis TaxID=60191 RepID=A0A224YC15_9ACAR
MGDKWLYYILLLSVCYSMVDCLPTLIRKTYDIQKFVWTKSLIWTYNTTRRGHEICKVDKMKYINHTTIIYHHYAFKQYGTKVAYTVVGQFYNDRKDLMVARVPGYKIKEELIYYNHERKCAVIRVTTPFIGGFQTFDLRVWDSHLKLGPAPECVRKFSKKEKKWTCYLF